MRKYSVKEKTTFWSQKRQENRRLKVEIYLDGMLLTSPLPPSAIGYSSILKKRTYVSIPHLASVDGVQSRRPRLPKEGR